MRKIIYLLSSFLLTFAGLTSCNEDPESAAEQTNKVAWIKIEGVNGGLLNLNQDDTFPISVLMYPEEATDKDEYSFLFQSSNNQVITISEDGVITAVGGGDATISVVPSHNEKLSFSFKVHVKANPAILLDDEIANGIIIEIDPAAAKHNEYNLSEKLKVVPEEAEDKTLTYSIAEESIADINENTGVITPKSLGKTIVTVTWIAGSITREIPLTIKELMIAPLDRSNWSATDLIDPNNQETSKLIDEDKESFCKLTKDKVNAVKFGFIIDRKDNNPFHTISIDQTGSKGTIVLAKIYGNDDNGNTWNEITNLESVTTSPYQKKLDKQYTYQYIKIEFLETNPSNAGTMGLCDFTLIGDKNVE